MLENCVFLHLRRKYKDIFYYQDDGECDFIIKERGQMTQAIQVSYTLAENKEREIAGLIKALKKFRLKNGYLITNDQEDHLTINNIGVIVLPAWKWLSRK